MKKGKALMRRIGMLTSGGDCQSLNATMRGVAKSLYKMFDDIEIVGFEDGYKGLMYADYRIMKQSDISGILTRGGTILGTSRQPFKLMRTPDENGLDKVEAMYREWNTLPGIVMRGMHCYDGHRHESSVQEREVATAPVDKQIEEIKARLKAAGIGCEILIMGGAPSFPVHAEMTGEFLSPGTCVIQDAGYRKAYPDLKFPPAAALLTRVVSRPSRDTFTLDLGCKAVATDPQPERAEIVGMEYARTVIQNEEHWVVRVPEEHIADIPPIGTELFAIPTHVCPTSALYPAVPVVENGKVTGWWKVAARDRRLTL